ncbi:hypothetical protein MPHL43072_10620 [Mycolicibacterium phlei DSM 43072]|nr:hypothetical protein MPHL43072_10620 [Mycolicibacterium phlei DSM 43072]KXW72752.1 hypothetical protein MPHL43070_14585 [Mycolicibacterium phlei DSM 43070]
MPGCSGHHSRVSAQTASRPALATSAVTLPVAPATTPHTSEPTAWPPMNTS